ncbi:MAG: QueT transporter family protein [archaeon YNP-LCB-003-016]|uniref:QueT transporter family protein n=1 Tax=Candidatus Culexarchaeum yellowstonense TaxID=2928963 RepID=UPI0026F2B4E3|nr:QueT transporter family protein [Candidatus Culexarchaeum yellowstonense]MCR6691715.1 QueT transporter family protein [Candidatus Culexarchaeum yellowstonense]
MRMRIATKDVALISLYAALYATLVYIFTPISFQALQFRVAGILRPAIAKKWKLAIAYAIGVIAGNIVSPFVGAWELVFMPIMSFISGILGYLAGRLYRKLDYYICGVVIALIIPLSVSFMLNQLFNLPMTLTFPMLLVSEQIVNFIGATIFKFIEQRFGDWWK